MDKEYVIATLKQNNIAIAEEKRMGNDLGTVIKTYHGCLINLYDSGTVSYQGKNTKEVEDVLKEKPMSVSNRKVFVVYGHDMNARTQLEAMLRRWDLEPLIIDQLASAGNTIIEKLEENIDKASFGIVLATPDDIGYAKDDEAKKRYRVRQNVVLELGILLAKLGRPKVAILLSLAEDMEKPSDIDGLIYIPFTANVEETKLSLAKEMQENGYHIDISKL